MGVLTGFSCQNSVKSTHPGIHTSGYTDIRVHGHSGNCSTTTNGCPYCTASRPNRARWHLLDGGCTRQWCQWCTHQCTCQTGAQTSMGAHGAVYTYSGFSQGQIWPFQGQIWPFQGQIRPFSGKLGRFRVN